MSRLNFTGVLISFLLVYLLMPINTFGGYISGSIFDPQGRLLTGEPMRVEISQNFNDWISTITNTGVYQIETGMGMYVVRCGPVLADSWYVTLYYSNSLSEEEADWVFVPEQGIVPNINFNMIRGGKFGGAITPAEGGEFDPNSIMVFYYDNPQEIWEPTGMFIVPSPNNYLSPALPPGGYIIRFIPIPPNPHTALFYRSTPLPFEAEIVQIEPGAVTDNISIQLPLGGEICGTILGNGEPLEGSLVIALMIGQDYIYPMGSSYSEANGDYSLIGLPSGSYCLFFQSSMPEFASEWYRGVYNIREATPVNVVAGQETPNINANLRYGAVFTGTIRSPENEPLTGNEVFIELLSSEFIFDFDNNIINIDENGVWRTERAVVPGPYAIRVWCHFNQFVAHQIYPNAIHSWDAQWIFVAGGNETQPIDIRMQRGGMVEGVITGPDGNPLERARVELYDNFGEISSTETQMNGRFEITNIPPGNYCLGAYYMGENLNPDETFPYRFYGGGVSPNDAQRFNVVAGETTTINIQLVRGGLLHINILNQQGEPYDGFVNGVGIIPIPITENGIPLWNAVNSFLEEGPPVVGADGVDFILPTGRYTVLGAPLYIDNIQDAPNVRRTFLGGGFTRNGATFINLAVGGNESADLTMTTEGYSISGTARTIENNPGMNVEIVMDTDGQLVCGYLTALTPFRISDGSWAVKGIPNGEYHILSTPMEEEGIIVSTWFPNIADPGVGPENPQVPQNAGRVRVNGADVSNVDIILQYVRNYVSVPGSNKHLTLPQSFTLYEAYPNPFNNITTISFSCARSAKVSLKLYDVQGREVMTLADKPFTAGFHLVKVDAKELAGGVYFIKMKSGDFEASRKIVLLK